MGKGDDEILESHMNRMWRIKCGGIIDMNPIVSLGAAILIWGFCVLSALFPITLNGWLTNANAWVTTEWSWIYISSQNIWVAVLIYLACSKYRHLKLGKDDEEPEYSFATWFAMLFTCGVATGLWWYTAESMWHYKGYGAPRFGDLVDNERAIHSMMVTWYHWGLHGWIPYTLVGALVAIMTYRRDMPMTMRFTMYPLIGDKVYGWIGDAIDILSIVVTLFGVCTSLGLGVMQIHAGINRIDAGTYRGVSSNDNPIFAQSADSTLDPLVYNTRFQIIIIWVITALATVSVVSGIDRGIKTLAQIGFFLSLFVVLCVLFMGETAFVLNAICSTIGYYIWFLPKISFHTDAFELLGPANCTDVVASARDTTTCGIGGAPDGNAGGAGWMDLWTIFYWGWWISWGPFVGTFMAKISRGRTLGTFIVCTLIVPSMYSFFFMGVWGAEGIRIQNMADTEGLTCANAYSETTGAVNLWCMATEDLVFDHISAYGGKTISTILSIVILFSVVIYFVTSSDSGSLVIDIMAANGKQEPPILQRIFWAFSEGATASVLLNFGADAALKALRGVSLVCGLPYTFVLFAMCQSLYFVVQEEMGDLDPNRPGMKSFFTNIDHSVSGTAAGWSAGLIKILIATVCWPLQLCDVMRQVWGGSAIVWFIVTAAIEGSFAVLIFVAAMGWEPMCYYVAMAVFVVNAIMMASVRMAVRQKIGSERGDWLTDLIVCGCCWMFAVPQMAAELSTANKAQHADNKA